MKRAIVTYRCVNRGRLAPWTLALVVLAAAACDRADDDTVARAGGEVLSVDQVVDLLVDQPQLPADEGVVRAVAELWVNYTLLGVAARRDSTLASLDLSAVIAPREEERLIMALREEVIHVDTVLGDDELRFLFDRDQPGVRLKARHILLHFNMTRPESRDSAMALAAQLRGRIVGGESFAGVARQYSKDPASAAAGGDLGDFFPRERMVAAFSDAAFALEPGTISQPVETQFGIHLIRVDQREAPSFDEVKEAFRNTIKNQRVETAESTYVATLEKPAAATILEPAYQIVRELARDPGQQLKGRAASTALVEYEGGTFTAGEYRDFIRNQSPAFRSQVTLAPNAQLSQMLEGLTRGELLVARAREQGLELTAEQSASLEEEAREQFRSAVNQLGITAAGGPPVIELLREMLQGERDVIPLGALGYTLRDRFDGRIVEAGLERAVERVAEERQVVAPPVFAPPLNDPDVPDSTGAPGDGP